MYDIMLSHSETASSKVSQRKPRWLCSCPFLSNLFCIIRRLDTMTRVQMDGKNSLKKGSITKDQEMHWGRVYDVKGRRSSLGRYRSRCISDKNVKEPFHTVFCKMCDKVFDFGLSQVEESCWSCMNTCTRSFSTPSPTDQSSV